MSIKDRAEIAEAKLLDAQKTIADLKQQISDLKRNLLYISGILECDSCGNDQLLVQIKDVVNQCLS